MAASAAFEALCSELSKVAGMDRWTARGALQLALMDAGLEKTGVTAPQLAIVVERLLPRQLQSHGGLDVGAVCRRLRGVLELLPAPASDEGAEEVFSRLSD